MTMKKLSDNDIKRRDDLSNDLREKVMDLIVAHAKANDAYREIMQPALDAYNEAQASDEAYTQSHLSNAEAVGRAH
jgi:hypothetical protein